MNRFLHHAGRVPSLGRFDGGGRRLVGPVIELPISRAAAPWPRTVELHIQELVLHGFAPSDRQLISDAVQCELARLFENRELPSSISHGVEIGRVDGGAFIVPPGSSAAGVGTQVAHAVYGGL